MGISWSSGRRRNNTYYQQNPHHRHHPFHYAPETLPLPSPPPPPPPPPPPRPPPHQNYFTTTTNTRTTTPPSHPPNLSPPIHPYYSSHPYHSTNYANNMIGRFNYQPPYYYANHSNGWTALNAERPIQPVPYVEHQNAKKVKNDVNVHKDTLKFEIDEHNPDNYLVSFIFDATFDGSITIFYFAKEEPNCKFVPLFPEAHLPVKIPFHKGLGQKFHQPSGTGIDLGFFELDDLAKPSPEDVFPLVIVAETCSPANSTDKHVDDSESSKSGNLQITQAVLEKKNGDSFQVRVIKQILWIDGVRYKQCDLYGIESSAAEGFDDSDPGKECVICMTEPKNIAVLPCRHMCMCSECAKELRLQSNKCPICRQPIQELIEIKIKDGN